MLSQFFFNALLSITGRLPGGLTQESTMARVYNFSAGPSCLPEEVLKECAAEMLDYQGSGQSVMDTAEFSDSPILTL